MAAMKCLMVSVCDTRYEGAAAHAEAARSHLEIAAHDANRADPPGTDHQPGKC